MLLHVGAVPAEGDQTLDRAVGIDARGIGAEMRDVARAGRRDQYRVTAGGGDPDEVRAQGAAEEALRFLEVARGAAGRNDAGPAGRPGEVVVERPSAG